MSILDNKKYLNSVYTQKNIDKLKRQEYNELDTVYNIVKGNASWVDNENGIYYHNIPDLISSALRDLTTLEATITIETTGCTHLEQKRYKRLIEKNLIAAYERALLLCFNLGSAALKYNGHSIDVFKPKEEFIINRIYQGEIKDIEFYFWYYDDNLNAVFRRTERHYYNEKNVYIVENTCDRNGASCELSEVEIWKDIEPMIELENTLPLYSVLKLENTDMSGESYVGRPIWYTSYQHIEELDILFSRMNEEVQRYVHTLFVGQNVIQTAKRSKTTYEIPRFVSALGMGGGGDNDYDSMKEFVPIINSDKLIGDINLQLTMIAQQCGVSPDILSYQKTVSQAKTATEVEASERRTIQTISRFRRMMQNSVEEIIDSIIYTDYLAYGFKGSIEFECHFGDVIYSFETDKKQNYEYVKDGYLPMWQYLVKFEGMDAKRAKQLIAEQEQIANANMIHSAESNFGKNQYVGAVERETVMT